jgi:hypothetical protein
MPSHSCKLSVAIGVWKIAYNWRLDVAFADDQMRLREGANNLGVSSMWS